MKKFLFFALIIMFFIILNAGFKDNTVEYLDSINLPKWLVVIIISALPIIELRGGIPVAINFFSMNPVNAYFLAVFGNILPIIPILFLFDHLYVYFKKWKYTRIFFDYIYSRAEKKSGQVEKYKMFGLMIFVAIPLPVTGAWTGSLISLILGMHFFHSFLSILSGVLFAGIIVTILSIMGIWGAIVALTVLLILSAVSMLKIRI